MYPGILPGCGLDQMPVPKGKGIGVHHDGGSFPFPAGLFQSGQITGKTLFPVFHEGQGVAHRGDFIEAQVSKDSAVFLFGIEKDMGIAPLHLMFHQMADDLVHEPFAPVGSVYGQTAEGAAKAAARGQQRPTLIKKPAAVIQIPVPADALLFQKGIHCCQGLFVGMGNGADRNCHGTQTSGSVDLGLNPQWYRA